MAYQLEIILLEHTWISTVVLTWMKYSLIIWSGFLLLPHLKSSTLMYSLLQMLRSEFPTHLLTYWWGQRSPQKATCELTWVSAIMWVHMIDMTAACNFLCLWEDLITGFVLMLRLTDNQKCPKWLLCVRLESCWQITAHLLLTLEQNLLPSCP